jgi:hypothetical protein
MVGDRDRKNLDVLDRKGGGEVLLSVKSLFFVKGRRKKTYRYKQRTDMETIKR